MHEVVVESVEAANSQQDGGQALAPLEASDKGNNE